MHNGSPSRLFNQECVREGLKLSSLKPRLVKTIVNLYRFLKIDKQKEITLNDWKTAGVTELIFYVMHK